MNMQEKSFSLNLTAWQARMAEDFLDIEESVGMVTLNPGVIKCPASYKIPVDGLSRRDWVLYLTDTQMELVQKEFGLSSPISGINITEALIRKGEIVFQPKIFKLDLVAWQARMVQDFLDTEKAVNVVTIKPGVIKCPASYKIPVEGLSRRDWVLYLTDIQMGIVQEEFGLMSPVSGINITEGLVNKGDVAFM